MTIDKRHITNVKNALFTEKPKNLLPYASVEYNRTMSLYYRLTTRFEKAYLYSKNEMNVWVENSKVFNDRIMLSKYINGKINHLEILFFLEAYDQCEIEHRQLQDNVTFIDVEHNNHIRYLTQSYLLKLSINLIAKNYSKNALLISEIERSFLSKVKKQKVPEFLFIFAINSFYQKQWNDSLYYTNKIINEYASADNADIDCLSHFFRILAHFELENIEIVENLIQRFKYKIPEMTSLFKGFRQYFKQPLFNKRLPVELLNGIGAELDARKHTHQLYLKWYYFAFSHWINSNMQN